MYLGSGDADSFSLKQSLGNSNYEIRELPIGYCSATVFARALRRAGLRSVGHPLETVADFRQEHNDLDECPFDCSAVNGNPR